jgi:hypothetical protein
MRPSVELVELNAASIKTLYEQNIMFSQQTGVVTDPWYRSLAAAMQEYAEDPVQVTGHLCVLCPTLDDIGALLEMVRIPHICKRALVIVAPLTSWRGADERARREMEIDWEEIMAFDAIHLVVGMHDDPQTLFRANVTSAHSVMILSAAAAEDGVSQFKKASGGDTSYARSRMDSALILTALGVFVELHQVHYTLYTLYTTHCTLYTQYTTHCTLYTQYTIHCTLYTQYTLYTVHTIHYTLYTVHTIHYTLYTVHTIHYTLYTVHTIHYTLYTHYRAAPGQAGGGGAE